MNASEVSMKHLATDLKAVAHDGEELLKASASDLGDAASEMRQRLATSIESARATCRKLQEKTVAGAKKADKLAHAHPYQTAGIAFGVGLLVGILATRRGRNG